MSLCLVRKARPFAVALTFFTAASPLSAQQFRQPAEHVDSPALRERAGLLPSTNLLFNGWGMTPAGKQIPTKELALKLIVAPGKKCLLAVHGGYNHHGVTLFDIATQQETQFLPLAKSWNGLAFSPDGKQFYVSGGDSGYIYIFKYSNGKATFDRAVRPMPLNDNIFVAGIAVHPSTGKLYVCNEANHEIWVLAPKTLAIEATVPVGQHPHSCVIGADRANLYVSNWGSRNISVVDLSRNRKRRDIAVGIRPNDMALAPDGRLFVACAGDNTVHVIQTKTLEALEPGPSLTRRPPEGAREIISTSLYPGSPEGSTPDAVAVSSDGRTLFVANADNNNVMVVDISNALFDEARRNGESVSVVEGFIPVGWYPSAVAVSPDNKTIFVANGKGLQSHSNFPAVGAKPRNRNTPLAFDHIATTLSGSLSAITLPDFAKMATYTEQVRRNSPYTPEQFQRASIPSHSIIPSKVGDPCPIKYVLYIIKENRTYDQVMGDFRDAHGRPAGNGDSNLTLYGESVTPNQHKIAREYVLLDNLYCNGEVSYDGHSWCDAAIATDWNQRSWMLSYSRHGKLAGNQEMEIPSAGYLWDLCRRHGVSYKNYGEGAKRVPSANRGDWSTGRDMDRVQFWIDDLKAAEKTGVLPRFTIMSLGENHTRGTTPSAFTPDACVASNDLGVGRIVEAASRSRFWKEMAIFIIEDDAQNGPDHVDAHRTVGFVISPYCKRGVVDSTLYTTASMIRTMELILGLPPLTQFDAAATPMFHCFTSKAEVTHYQVEPARVDLFAKNTSRSPGAKQSAKMNFREYDRAPEDELNRILWRASKGDDAPYPAPIHRAVFTSAAPVVAE